VIKFPKYVPDVSGSVTKSSKQWMGVTYRGEGEFLIYISMRNCLQTTQCIETALHEYAHAYLWPAAKIEFTRPEHGPMYWTMYGELWDAFTEGGGGVDSKKFPYD